MLQFIVSTAQVRTALLEQKAAALLQHFALGQFSESCYLSGLINFSMLTTGVHTHTQRRKEMEKNNNENQKRVSALHSPRHKAYWS